MYIYLWLISAHYDELIGTVLYMYHERHISSSQVGLGPPWKIGVVALRII